MSTAAARAVEKEKRIVFSFNVFKSVLDISVVLVGPDAELLHQAAIRLEIAVHELRECFRATADRLLPGMQETLADRRFGERLVELGAETRDDDRLHSRL